MDKKEKWKPKGIVYGIEERENVKNLYMNIQNKTDTIKKGKHEWKRTRDDKFYKKKFQWKQKF